MKQNITYYYYCCCCYYHYYCYHYQFLLNWLCFLVLLRLHWSSKTLLLGVILWRYRNECIIIIVVFGI